MELTNIPLSKPVKPSINEDGWYAQCQRCWAEIQPSDMMCPNCKQKQDWSWFYKED